MATQSVFISYRRTDSAEFGARIHESLTAEFGRHAVFRDEESIAAGTDFVDTIERALQHCVAMIVLIGMDWVTAETASGSRRLDSENDIVRMEVARALIKGIPVIPVVLPGATMPRPEELPYDISELAQRNAVFARDESDATIQRVTDDLIAHISRHTDWRFTVANAGERHNFFTYLSVGVFIYSIVYMFVLAEDRMPLVPPTPTEFVLYVLICGGWGATCVYTLIERFGQTTLRVEDGHASIFEGMWSIGTRRQLEWVHVCRVEKEKTYGIVNDWKLFLVVRSEHIFDAPQRIRLGRFLERERREELYRNLKRRIPSGYQYDMQSKSGEDGHC